MKKIWLVLVLQVFLTTVHAEPFSYLEKKKIKTTFKTDFFIHYNQKLYQEIFKERGKLPKAHPLYTDEFGMDDVVLGVFDVSGKGEKYYITFSEGASFDPNFCLNKASDVDKASVAGKRLYDCDESVFSLSLVVPGNSNLYSYGHTNAMLDVRKKYAFRDDKFTLVQQPFYFSGKQTVSLIEQDVTPMNPCQLYHSG